MGGAGPHGMDERGGGYPRPMANPVSAVLSRLATWVGCVGAIGGRRRAHRLLLVAGALAGTALLPVTALGGATTTEEGGPDRANVVDEPALGQKLGKRWEVELGKSTSVKRLLAAEGILIVVVDPPTTASTEMRAFDLATGRARWTAALPPSADSDAALAAGRIVFSADGGVTALDLATGRNAWVAKVDGTMPRTLSPPGAAGDAVYVLGTSESRSTDGLTAPKATSSLYALRASDGGRERVSPSGLGVDGRSAFTPVIDAGRVLLADVTGSLEAHARSDGRTLWSRIGGQPQQLAAPRLSSDRVLRDDGLLLDAATGQERGRVPETGQTPVFAPPLVVTRDGRSLRAVDVDSGLDRWRVNPPDPVASGPLLAAGGLLFQTRGSALVARRLDDGRELFSSYLESSREGESAGQHLAAADGVLVAERDSVLTAFAPGADAPGLSPRQRPPQGATVRLRVGSSGETTFGLPVRLAVDLEGAASDPASDHVLVLEHDPAPFGDGWSEVRRRVAKSNPSQFFVRPERNTRYRVVIPRFSSLVSPPATVLSSYGARFGFRPLPGRRLRATVRLRHSPAQRIAGRRVFFYLVSPRGARRVGSARARRTGTTTARARATFRVPNSRRETIVAVCVRERRLDLFGRPTPFARGCGRKRFGP